ncbi:hypothetical protein ANCDUO_07360 [Ancylostoma duodenale]|uniref:Methyltransferase domain-containing protein n=1 Tax=Ancylostoma duodenale TaxID=51022 RepID=A0A0C2DIQ6_9BILA|nr:hypothetical protein ANCDUO_07360 [Ancylostoma duodenale]
MDEFSDFVIEKYSWLIDSYMTRYFIDDLWIKLPESWRLALQNIEPEECICLVDALVPSKTIVLPLSLLCLKTLVTNLPSREAVMSPAAVANLCGIQGETPQNFHNITSTNNLRTKLKPKKQYEIDRIVTTVELLRRRNPGTSAFDTVIDIGAGMGHLARILSASIRECNVIAVEQNEESMYLGQKALLIGLHPCGDLSASILRIFTRSPKVTTMILFGCCYHKLSTAEEEAGCSQTDSGELGFPLSAKYRWKRLSYAARDLACHGIETFAEQLLTKPHSAYRMQCYRAVLESLMTQSHDEEVCKQRSSIVVHSVVGKDGMTFEEYMRSALVRYPEIVGALEEQKYRVQTVQR